MYVLNSGNKHFFEKKIGVGLGNFDGLHLGHMTLINTLIKKSQLYNMECMVYTFMQHPQNILVNNKSVLLITSKWKKEGELSKTELDYLYFECFNHEYSKFEPEEFVKKILIDKLNAGLIVVGFDYRFGFKGMGDVALLRELAKKYKFKVVCIPPVKIGDEIVSSTLIREYIMNGDMDKAFKQMVRFYSLRGTVIKGKMMGREFGFPTANMIPEENMVVPATGVYVTKTLFGGISYDSVTNIGIAPTVGNSGVLVETYILDFEDDIYSREIEVFFIMKIRDEKKFESKDELICNIRKDVDITKGFFEREG